MTRPGTVFLAALAIFSSAVAAFAEPSGDAVEAARQKMGKGDYAAAISDLDRITADQPQNAEAFFQRGNARLAQKDYPAALADYDLAIAADPRLVSAYAGKSLVYRTLGEYDKAVAESTRAVEAVPSSAVGYHSRARSFEEGGRYAEAEADYARAIERDKNDVKVYLDLAGLYGRRSQPRKAAELYTIVIGREPSFMAYYGRANRLRELGKFREALADYSQCIKLAAASDRFVDKRYNLPGSYSGRAIIYYQLGRYKEAVEDLTRSLKLVEESEALWNRAAAYQKLGKDDLALADLDRCLVLRPEDVDALLAKAAVLLHLGRASEARPLYERYLTLVKPEANPAGVKMARDSLKKIDAAAPRDRAVS
ncbi:MAG TPA: tetratricopeptide repeat protein [Candidatus Eisenbacteria bacterium]|nr:tetratricopeptide repeat protein [Candidatus Eisenbacteria bacterium]